MTVSSFACRYAYTADQVNKKPGREVVTFLLVCNLGKCSKLCLDTRFLLFHTDTHTWVFFSGIAAMWAINTLETSRADSHPIQVEFYGGEWAWPIITHISMPLAIFYRFHSTVCLCEIWKKSFKYKSPAPMV